jgi:hypothetical protein
MKSKKTIAINRRKFIGGVASAALTFTIVPRHVLGGNEFVAPSDKLTMAYIGTGTQGLREMVGMLTAEKVQIVAVCDPNKEAVGYRDWGKTYLLDQIRKVLNKPTWTPGGDNLIPGGRDNGKDIVTPTIQRFAVERNSKAAMPTKTFARCLRKRKISMRSRS